MLTVDLSAPLPPLNERLQETLEVVRGILDGEDDLDRERALWRVFDVVVRLAETLKLDEVESGLAKSLGWAMLKERPNAAKTPRSVASAAGTPDRVQGTP